MTDIPPGADRLLVVLSDIEMGAGGPTDDFPHTAFLADLLARYSQPPYDGLAVDLVFNGDTFDLLKTSVGGAYPRRVTAAVANEKLARVAAVHRPFFEGLRRFLTSATAPRQVHFVVGNHDAELLFPSVQAGIRARVGAPGVRFPGYTLRIGDVHVEHGAQVDSLFRMDPAAPFLQHDGQEILNLPWGAVALLDVALPLQPYLYPLDRLKPRKRVFELMPEIRDLIVNAYWRYWTRDYWRGYLRNRDPTRKISWTMCKEIVYRFGSRDPDIDLGEHYQRLLERDDGPRVVLIGHLHQASWLTYGDRKLLRTGCMRDEYMIEDGGRKLTPIPKSYAEVFLRGGRSIRSHLVELDGPPAPPGHMPDDLFAVLAEVLPLLGTAREREADAAAQQAQEKKEARLAFPGRKTREKAP